MRKVAQPEPELSQEEEQQIFFDACREELLTYTMALDENYIASKVNKLIAGLLEDIAAGKRKRLIITLPPRIGKSRIVCEEFATWVLGRNPKARIVVASYGQNLADKASRRARARLGDDLYSDLFPDTKLSEEASAVEDWQTTAGGGYKAVGVGGPLTGHGCDFLICDDLIKDFREARSQARLEAIWDWFWSVAYSRLEPNGCCVIIMTRWAQGDLVGRLQDPARMATVESFGRDAQWEVVNIPALCDSKNDPLGRRIGQSIMPERFPESRLREIQAQVGSFIWSSLYQGKPTAKGGNAVPVEKLNVITPAEVPDGVRWVRFWDLAAEDKKYNDKTASIQCGMSRDNSLYLRNGIAGQWKWPKSREMIASLAIAERVPVGIEAQGGFKTAFANLMEVIDPRVTIREYTVDTDKFVRALPWIAMTEKSKVFIVADEGENPAWITDFMFQCEGFPEGTEDDYIDSVSGGIRMLSQNVGFHNAAVNSRVHRAMQARRQRTIDG